MFACELLANSAVVCSVTLKITIEVFSETVQPMFSKKSANKGSK